MRQGFTFKTHRDVPHVTEEGVRHSWTLITYVYTGDGPGKETGRGIGIPSLGESGEWLSHLLLTNFVLHRINPTPTSIKVCISVS